MKAHWGCGGTALLIFNLGAKGRCDISVLTKFSVNEHFKEL